VLTIVALALVAYGLFRMVSAGARAWLFAGLALAAIVAPLVLALIGPDYLIARNVIASLVPLAVAVAAGFATSRAGIAAAAGLCAIGVVQVIAVNTQERYARQPHNLLFEIWFNLGPLGLLAFGWLLARCLRRTRATLRFPPSSDAALIAGGVLAALAAALVHGMVDSFYFWPDIAIAFWLLLGVSELIEQHSRKSAG